MKAFWRLVVAGSCWSVVAHAQPDDATRAAARDVSYAGVEAFQQGNLPLAVDKLGKAYAVLRVPSVGLWLARALEKSGKWVEAAERYLEVTRLPTSGGDVDVQLAAQRDAASERDALLPRVPRLVLSVEGAVLSDTQVLIDHVEIPSQLLGEPRYLNPGPHGVEVKYRGQVQKRALTLAEGETKPLTLTFTAAAPAPEAAPAPGVPARQPNPPSAAPPAPPSADAVLLKIRLPANEQDAWTLRDATGRKLCELPCRHWVRPGERGFYLQREAMETGRRARIPLASELPYASGTSVEATPRPARGNTTAALWTMGGGATLLVVGTVLAATTGQTYDCQDVNNDRGFYDHQDCQYSGSNDYQGVGAIIGITGGMALIGGGIWWLLSHGPKVDLDNPERVGFQVTPVGLAFRSRDRRGLVAGPGFIAGQF